MGFNITTTKTRHGGQKSRKVEICLRSSSYMGESNSPGKAQVSGGTRRTSTSPASSRRSNFTNFPRLLVSALKTINPLNISFTDRASTWTAQAKMTRSTPWPLNESWESEKSAERRGASATSGAFGDVVGGVRAREREITVTWELIQEQGWVAGHCESRADCLIAAVRSGPSASVWSECRAAFCFITRAYSTIWETLSLRGGRDMVRGGEGVEEKRRIKREAVGPRRNAARRRWRKWIIFFLY